MDASVRSWYSDVCPLSVDDPHDNDSVRGDFDHFAPWIPLGGCVTFHEYPTNFPRLVTCVDQIRQQGCFALRDAEANLIVLQRPTTGPPP